MTLAYVQFVVAIVAGLVVSWAGLTVAVGLMLPERTGRAERALEQAPLRCFLGGLPLLGVLALSLNAIRVPNPGVKLLGFLVVLCLGSILMIGAAGLAQLMGKRIADMSGARTSFGMLVRGSLTFSAAAFFPILGWWVFAPLSAVCALGAGVQACLPARRERAREQGPAPTDLGAITHGAA